jgi:hypothetical protein
MSLPERTWPNGQNLSMQNWTCFVTKMEYPLFCSFPSNNLNLDVQLKSRKTATSHIPHEERNADDDDRQKSDIAIVHPMADFLHFF